MEEGKAKKPFWKKWWFWGIVIVVLIAYGASGGDNKDQGTGTKDSGKSAPAVTEKAEKPDLEVTNHSTESDGYSTYIVGSVKNNTNKQYTYVQIEINLYDASGAQVGSTLDNTNNLEPGGTWKFKAASFEEFASYKIKDVTGY